MATTSIWKVEQRLDHVIDYAEDELKTHKEENESKGIRYKDLGQVINYASRNSKTDNGKYVTSINCDVRTAYQEMLTTKKHFNKLGGIIAFHAVQSFKEGEVTPEIAHKIGVELAKELWEDRFEVIVTTHLNTENIHNHFVINSVSFKDGKKYYDGHTTYARMRHISDEICERYGLSVLQEKPTKRTNIKYDNFYKKSLGIDYVSDFERNVKQDLDYAISQATSYEDFEAILRKMKYEIYHRGKSLSVLHAPRKRPIRINRRFGEDYSDVGIRNQIKKKLLNTSDITNTPKDIFPEVNSKFYKTPRVYTGKRSKNIIPYSGKLYRLYLYYGYLLNVYPKYHNNQYLSNLIGEDIKNMDRIQKQKEFISLNHIHSAKELLNFKQEINKQYNEIYALQESIRVMIGKTKNPDRIKFLRKKLKDLQDYRKILNGKEEMCNQIIQDSKEMLYKIREAEKEQEDEKQKELEEQKKEETKKKSR